MRLRLLVQLLSVAIIMAGALFVLPQRSEASSAEGCVWWGWSFYLRCDDPAPPQPPDPEPDPEPEPPEPDPES